MHVLTKIFIVLVTLLAIMLVPLVVVYAHNEESYQKLYQEAQAKEASARSALEAARATQGAAIARKDTQIQELQSASRELRSLTAGQEVEVRELQLRLADAESMDAEIRADLSTLTGAVDKGQQLTESLIDELRGLRTDALVAERQKVDLDQALQAAQANLDAAIEARRALKEELQRLKDEHARALDSVGQYVALYGQIQARGPESIGRAVDVDLDATVVNVTRGPDRTYAEIDAGSRDGVKEGWEMTIGHDGTFIARLRIISVDINRATGVVELEDEFSRGRVQIGHKSYARVPR